MALLEAYWSVRDFLDAGGAVLLVILGATFVMWTMILERLWYCRFVHPGEVGRAVQQWEARPEHASQGARDIRLMLVSHVKAKLDHSLLLIKTVIALCPLLGLLGTVSGMIEVFDVMAVAGGGNVRAMAAGVSKATIPTMAGMVAALSGLIISVPLERFSQSEGERIADRLIPRHEVQDAA